MAGKTVTTIDPTLPGPGDSARESKRQILTHGAQVGRYVILNVIGRGGMSVVYAAHDPQLDRQVALKLWRVDEGHEEAERLVREAKSLAKLDDPHVVAVYDAGEVDNQVFVAMQLVDGDDLAAALRKRHPTNAEVMGWFQQAGRGLAAAHAARIVHRDFKPSNVLIDKKGRVAVTDFGIARELGATLDPERRGIRSDVNRLMGTPAYMAPEQHALERATTASDQFAFCVSMWEALFGEHPYVGDRAGVSSVEIGIAIFEGKLIMPKRRRGVSRSVVDALVRGLQREQGKRWPAMTDLLARLAQPKRRARWPYAVAGVLVAGGAAAAVWHGTTPPSCGEARIDAVWPADHRAQLIAGITGRPYADRVATALAGDLDTYASRWRAQAVGSCTAPAPQACLDERLAELRGFVTVLAGKPALAIDATPALVASLPGVEACAHATATPPPEVEQLRVQTGEALARTVALDERERAKRELGDIATRAAKASWVPLVSHATYLFGRVELGLGDDGKTSLTSAAEMATAEGLDHDAARAWIAVLEASTPEELDTVAAMARATVARAGDRALAIDEGIAHGRALLHARRLDEAEQRCAGALRQALDAHAEYETTLARTCDLEAEEAQGHPPLDIKKWVEEGDRALGVDHPANAALLAIAARVQDGREDDTGTARAWFERVRAMRTELYPPNHPALALADRDLGAFAEHHHQQDEAVAEYTRALAIVEPRRDEVWLVGELHARLARLVRDPAIALSHARAAYAAAASPDLAVLIVQLAESAGAWDEAARVAADTLASPAALDREQLAMLDWLLARALVETHGDPARARQLATTAREAIVGLGGHAGTLAEIDAWLVRRR